MARIRTIKPDFWVDEKVVEISMAARLLFIGLWNFADDEGRMVKSVKKIRMQIFPSPTDDVNIAELLEELESKELIQTYSIDSTEYLQVCNFSKHQKIDKRAESKLPPPPNSVESPRLAPNPPDGREGKGRDKEVEGKGETAPPLPQKYTDKDFVERDYRKFCAERTELLRTEKYVGDMGTGERFVHGEWIGNLTDQDINKLAAQKAGIAPWRLSEMLEQMEPKAKHASAQ